MDASPFQEEQVGSAEMRSLGFTLGDVLDGGEGRLLGRGSVDLPLRATRLDSRRIMPGDLFVALPGAKHDGHDFVTDAFARGAAAALVARVPADCPWALDPSFDGPPLVLADDVVAVLHGTARRRRGGHPARVVGVAGSVATGTARELIGRVLAARGGILESDPELDPIYAVPLALLGLGPKDRYAVLELTSEGTKERAGEVRRLASTADPDLGVVMNVQPGPPGPERDAAQVAVIYAELVEALPPRGTAILNHDDRLVRSIADRGSARTLFFGLGPSAQVRGSQIVGRGLGGTELVVRYGGRSAKVVLPLVGLQSVHAALAAAAVGLAEGMALSEVAEALTHASASLRVVVARGINGALIVDDSYDATPESMLAALNLLSEIGAPPGAPEGALAGDLSIGPGRKVAVLGDMLGLGRTEESDHAKIGSRAARVVDLLVTVGPRAAIAAAEARRVGLSEAAVVVATDGESAVAQLRRRLLPGDTVLVTGSRDMRMERVVRALRVEA